VNAQVQKSKGKVKSKVVHASVPALKAIKIPLPPLDVQREIVRILDNFTELTAELTARKKQYEYYRNKLLTFGGDVPIMTLGEIAEIGTGSSNTVDGLESGLYPFYVRSQEVRYKNNYEYDETAIITSGDGVGVGKIFHFVQGKYALHQRAYRIHIRDKRINPKFYFYYMETTFWDLPYYLAAFPALLYAVL
jgi:type I restriction enzyme S subunit